MTDKQSGRSKGYGFVSYDSPQAAVEAIKKINGKQALGKRLKVELKKGGVAQTVNFPPSEENVLINPMLSEIEQSLNDLNSRFAPAQP